jgi:hypothetical protein
MPIGASSQVRARIRGELDVIRGFLREWDPIGVIPTLIEDGHPPSEYDSYADGVHALLSQGGDETRLTAHLQQLRTEAMGLPAALERDRDTAKRILAWWLTRQR